MNEEMDHIGNRMQIRQQATDYNESVPINRLPNELFCIVLKHLDLGDMFLYESVCKKWRYYVKSLVNERLVIAKSGKLKPRRWFFLNMHCSPSSVMIRDTLNIKLIEGSFMFALKQLKICDPIVNVYPKFSSLLEDVQFINQLVHLQVLELSQLGEAQEEEESITIKLPNLKHLALNHYFHVHLLLDCPKLVSLKIFKTTRQFSYYGNQTVDYLHPLSIKHLYLHKFSHWRNLNKLRNLEYLSVSKFSAMEDIEEKAMAKYHAETIFAIFPNLKAISIRPDASSYIMARETFVHLLKERSAFKREQVVLMFNSIQLDAEAQLEYQPEHFQTFDKFLYFLSGLYMRKHLKLCKQELMRIRTLDVSGLFDYSGEDKAEILTALVRKLDNVEEMLVSERVCNEDQLIDFITRFKHLNSLKISKKAQLKASFYEKLAATCSVAWLTIRMPSGFTYLNVVFKFNNLVGLELWQSDVDDGFVRRIFDHFGVFQLMYEIKKENVKADEVKITKRSKSRFEFSVSPGHLESFDNLDELLQKVHKCCRESYEEYHLHDCSCEIFYCPRVNYAENIRKERERLYDA